MTTQRALEIDPLELRAIGATNALHARRHTLTGKARFAAAARAAAPRARAAAAGLRRHRGGRGGRRG